MINAKTVEAVRERERESCILVNISAIFCFAINIALCTLKNIKINKKTEI